MSIYPNKVEYLLTSLDDPATRVQAAETILALVDEVVVRLDGSSHTMELVGELAVMLRLGTSTNGAWPRISCRQFRGRSRNDSFGRSFGGAEEPSSVLPLLSCPMKAIYSP